MRAAVIHEWGGESGAHLGKIVITNDEITKWP
jgi:hypothetical protein